jgi:hypothetical protein
LSTEKYLDGFGKNFRLVKPSEREAPRRLHTGGFAWRHFFPALPDRKDLHIFIRIFIIIERDYIKRLSGGMNGFIIPAEP